MGENLKRAIAQSFQVHGDRALRDRMGPTLFDNMPHVLEIDYTFEANPNVSAPNCGDDLTFEATDGGIRVLAGANEVARGDCVRPDYKELLATLVKVGGVAAAEVTESSGYGGGFRARLREEVQS